MSENGIDIDPDTGYAVGVAQREGAPFPEKDNIPTAHTELEQGNGLPDAFGSGDTAAPDGVEDATLDPPEGKAIPVTPEGAADALNDGAHEVGNEDENTAVAEWHRANNTSAEQLSGGDQQIDPAVDPSSTDTQRVVGVTSEDQKSAEPTSKLDTPENTPANVEVPAEDKPKRGRRTKAEIEADNAAAEAAKNAE